MDVSSHHPSRPISRQTLLLLLLVISLVPPIFVVSMVATYDPPPEPLLDVKVTLNLTVHAPRKAPDSPRILPCLTVENPTKDVWRNVSVYVNKDFIFSRGPTETLQPTQNFNVPLEFFVTKGGNVAFQPGSERVHQVTVFAQIPSGARAVREIFFDEQGNPIEKADSH
jgi:hypothetical protein